MPKKPIDYSNCCIYKIEHIENDTLIYVGHTTNFKQRKADHKKNCNNESNKTFNLKLYSMIRENGGFEMFKMIEVEKYPCNDRREAEKREDELMKELKATMNKIKSFRTEEYKIQYKEEYKKKIKEQRKQDKEDSEEKFKRYIINLKKNRNTAKVKYYENYYKTNKKE